MAPVIEFKKSNAQTEEIHLPFRALYKNFVIETQQQNLTGFDPRLAEFLEPSDFFHLTDLTDDLRAFVSTSGITHGSLVTQTHHTSAMIVVNELNEPMLLADIMMKMRAFVPKTQKYFHNSAMRVVNRCDEDTHCDRNADAHVKATMFGSPSVSLIVRDGELVLGQWQRIAFVEFDGPRRREVTAQLMGV